MNYKYKVKKIDDCSKQDIENIYKRIHNYKKEKIDNYRLDEDKKRSIIGEKIIIDLLDENGFVYDKLDFYTNQNGKPYIKDKSDLFFNISHSGKYITGVIYNKEIGIDIEEIKEVDLTSIKKYVSKEEFNYILSGNGEKYKRYFEIFCLKEAYVKMRGNCLKNIKEVNFEIYNGMIICSDEYVDCSLISNNDYVLAIIFKKV